VEILPIQLKVSKDFIVLLRASSTTFLATQYSKHRNLEKKNESRCIKIGNEWKSRYIEVKYLVKASLTKNVPDS
jgi:hypothetical protein